MEADEKCIITPGEQIRPQIQLSDAIHIAETLYGLKGITGRELNGYDDKNFHIQFQQLPEVNNPYIQKWPHGYVLKVMNSHDSKNTDLVEAQNLLIIYVGQSGITTPQPQRNVNGEYYSVETFNKSLHNVHIVRLLTYEDGTLLKDVPCSDKLFYNVGKYIANLDLTLQGFKKEIYNSQVSIWMLKNAPCILEFLYVFSDDKKVSMVNKIIREFKEQVLSVADNLKSGIIHGDFNEQNILCNKDINGEWYVCAVLDFGDAHYSAYVFELAITMCYMLIQSNNLETGAQVLAGYYSINPLSSEELLLLKLCICTRLCQSLVLGAYTYHQDPKNDYVMYTQEKGWTLLNQLNEISQDELCKIWKF